MAASKAQELRRLMKQQKNESRKIDHPFAKYNSIGQLTCQLCNHVLKSDLLWNTHLQSKRHRESVTFLKERKCTESMNKKRQLEENPKPDQPQIKKSKGILPNDFFDESSSVPTLPPPTTTAATTAKKAVKGILKNANKLNDHVTDTLTTSTNNTATKTIPESLDEFQSVSNTETKSIDLDEKDPEQENGGKKRKHSSNSEQLPEGFFDDPKQDAKARNVEYKDPKDEEWEKFQKMIQEETKISENIQEEEDEESEIMKDMNEFNNMKTCLSRVDRLKNLIHKKKTEHSKTTAEGTLGERSTTDSKKHLDGDGGDDVDNDDEDEYLEAEMFNWRAKMA